MTSLLDQAVQSGRGHRPFLRIMLWGGPGIGKTVTALTIAKHFGLKMMAIDAENRIGIYDTPESPWAGVFNYISTEDPVRVLQILDELLLNPRDYGMLFVDPVSTIWRHTQLNTEDFRRQIIQKRTGQATSLYQGSLTKADWGPIKRLAFRLASNIHRMGMPVIATAREKNAWSGDQIVGKEPDAEGSIGHEFDVVIHMTRPREGAPRVAYVQKDCWNKLPDAIMANDADDVFWIARSLIEGYGAAWQKEVEARPRATSEQVAQMQDLHFQLNLSDEAVSSSLAKYDADNYSDLTPEAAAEIITKMQGALLRS